MPAVCELICEKPKTETFNQKYVQDFSTFDVGVFLNSLRMKLQNMRLYAECCEGVNAGMSLKLFLVEQFIIMLQSIY